MTTRAQPGQTADDVGQARARPRPLTETWVGKALLVDIDDGDRPCLLDPGLDALEGIEGPDTQLLDRGRIEQSAGRRNRSAGPDTPAARNRISAQTTAAIFEGVSWSLDITAEAAVFTSDNNSTRPVRHAQIRRVRSTRDARAQTQMEVRRRMRVPPEQRPAGLCVS